MKTICSISAFLFLLAMPSPALARGHHGRASLAANRAKVVLAHELPDSFTVGPCHRWSPQAIRCDYRGPMPDQIESGWVEEGYGVAYLHAHWISMEFFGL